LSEVWLLNFLRSMIFNDQHCVYLCASVQVFSTWLCLYQPSSQTCSDDVKPNICTLPHTPTCYLPWTSTGTAKGGIGGLIKLTNAHYMRRRQKRETTTDKKDLKRSKKTPDRRNQRTTRKDWCRWIRCSPM
jgi:hypothetical protein